MNFTNINDPAGVKALLDQLRTSQAWQETVTPPDQATPDDASSRPKDLETASTSTAAAVSSSPSVASLLSQLQSSSSWSSTVSTPPTVAPRIAESPSIPVAPVRKDVRSYTFQQALPHLAKLSANEEFIASVTRIKKEQADLEKQLWEERRRIQQKYEEKVKIARIKASLIGTGLSKHEADMMQDAFRKEIQKFDLERVLPAWDGLISKQQAALEGLEVPAMFVTSGFSDRERQQRVIQILEGISGDSA